jgi:Ca-activated chloride channel family protein
MRTVKPILAFVLLLSAAASAQVFRSGTKIVPLFVTVTDREQRLVPDLTQADFEILEDGKPRKIELFENKTLPISVVVMLDTSGSMTLVLDHVRAGAEQFIIRLLPEDKGAVGAFNDKIEVYPAEGLTADRDELTALLKELDFGYPTRLYDAINFSMEHVRGVEGRKVVLVFTDGEDTASRLDAGEVVDRARLEEVMIYGIGLRTSIPGVPRSRPDRVLKRLADETGGGYFELKATDELNSTFTRIAQELHSQYVLGFAPLALDGKVHKLEVRLKRPGMSARARKTYVAAPEGTATR